MTDDGAMKALRAERKLRRQAEADLQRIANEAAKTSIHITKLSAENRRLKAEHAAISEELRRSESRAQIDRGALQRREQTIAGLRQALENRKDQIHV